ncbi:phosphotransferase [Streptomyces sp. NPDC006992]|uniref:phosphotransferase enzyme family protein n=1 Tax=Streptomyces sp. NPDC006992 TaxID=3155601 RepID=UPI00340A4FA5
MGDAGKLASASLSPNEPAEIAAAFGLGDVHEVSYLAAGLMNRNWRLSCDSGVVALKQILDVPVHKVRRSLAVTAQLAELGLPVCAPRRTVAGEFLADVEGRTYCVLPWAAGSHREGPQLSLDEAAELGRLLGPSGPMMPAASSSGRHGRRRRGERRRAASPRGTQLLRCKAEDAPDPTLHAASHPEWRARAQHRVDCLRGRCGPRPWQWDGIL